MIKHIVMFQFHGVSNKNETLKQLKDQMEDLKNSIQEIAHLEAGINFSKRDAAYDLVLVSDFQSEEDLETYRQHPEHLKLIDELKKHNYEVAVVDYKY